MRADDEPVSRHETEQSGVRSVFLDLTDHACKPFESLVSKSCLSVRGKPVEDLVKPFALDCGKRTEVLGGLIPLIHNQSADRQCRPALQLLQLHHILTYRFTMSSPEIRDSDSFRLVVTATTKILAQNPLTAYRWPPAARSLGLPDAQVQEAHFRPRRPPA